MKHPFRFGAVLFFFAALTAPVGAESAPGLTKAEIAAMGLREVPGETEAPDFTLKGLDGKSVTLSSLKGKVVLLNFWATWCPPCREEMPSLEKLYQSMKSRSDIVILAVSLQETPDTVAGFLKKTPYHFPILLDTDGAAGSEYAVSAIPTTYLIDARGIVVAGTAGAHDWASPETSRGLNSLLKTIR